mmetsp:Transcript_1625/g.1117  ORF Transcript_1625/g.1117 Transcript_1625/m.1117 type:complete len:100 (+) Transcript_1625:4928-5227(+)
MHQNRKLYIINIIVSLLLPVCIIVFFYGCGKKAPPCPTDTKAEHIAVAKELNDNTEELKWIVLKKSPTPTGSIVYSSHVKKSANVLPEASSFNQLLQRA